jgi:hypothetical protein
MHPSLFRHVELAGKSCLNLELQKPKSSSVAVQAAAATSASVNSCRTRFQGQPFRAPKRIRARRERPIARAGPPHDASSLCAPTRDQWLELALRLLKDGAIEAIWQETPEGAALFKLQTFATGIESWLK